MDRTQSLHAGRWTRRLSKAWRVGALLFCVCALAGGVGYLIYSVMQPVIKQQDMAADLRCLEHAVAEKTRERDTLQRRKAIMKTPQGAEELGRRNGMVLPGEHRVIALRPTRQTAPTAPTPTHAPPLMRALLWPTFVLGGLIVTLGLVLLARRLRATREPRQDGVLATRSMLRRRHHAPRPM